VYRHYAFLGDRTPLNESLAAAEATECASEQGKFWEYHDLLFQRQGPENAGVFSRDNLKAWAPLVGLDAAKFGQCLDSGKYGDAVKAETNEGSRLGVRGTPSIFVDGKQVPLDGLDAAIQQAIASKGK
jgi:protein-disulfide isomerase